MTKNTVKDVSRAEAAEKDAANLRRLLREVIEWNWLDWNENLNGEREHVPELAALEAEPKTVECDGCGKHFQAWAEYDVQYVTAALSEQAKEGMA